MHFLLTVLAFLVIFSVLILVHEFGHFYMAKRNGIKVEEFGFGLPPRIWGHKYGETLYSINWIPFGGFVRMLGEDERDSKIKKNPRSFAHKSLWQRTQVVLAGVVMNFLLALVLLSFGFTVGMQPLILDGDDFLEAIRSNQIELNFIADQGQATLLETEGKQIVELPQVFLASTKEGTPFLEGDRIYAVNGVPVFSGGELQDALDMNPVGTADVTLFRNGEKLTVPFALPEAHRALITWVEKDSPAERAGIMAGYDRVIRVNGQEVWLPEQVVAIMTANQSKTVVYEVERWGGPMRFEMTPKSNGLVGIMLGTYSSPANQPFAYYDGVMSAEVTTIKPSQYPWYQSPFEALSEMKRVSGYTALSIGGVFKDIFTTGKVPEGVAGPVGIAQMTGIYVQEGFMALVRFLAMLSLSLAVINVFPFPALDGGRFLFILIEAVRGKPVDARLERIIHSLGFVVLMAVILLVTFQDVRRLFE